MKILVI